MAEGLSQITIPDLDDDDFSSPSVPFGRGANAFKFGSSSGADSPTLLTPTAGPEKHAGDRDYFHARQDSAASEDSAFSFQAPSTSFAARSNTSLQTAHSSQASLPTSAPFTKKSSFASLRNAFKSGGKSSETPPVPSFDRQAYPALRNPFNRSASSLAHSTTAQNTRSPPSGHQRPPTPSSTNDHRHGRAMSSRSGNQVYGRSHHSHSGSMFHNSDAGSDYSFGFHHIAPRQSTPPPVPRVPNEYSGLLPRTDMPYAADTEDRVVIDPRTPSEYALHAIFMQFAAVAEAKIDQFLKQPLERDLSLTDLAGPQIDSKFDGLLVSLGQIAMKTTKPVVDSIMRWRRSQQESVSGDVILLHSSSSSTIARATRPKEIVNILNERKSLASIYIMCRALIAVVQTVSRDALGESLGFSLEETTFDQFKRPNLKLLSQSRNHRVNADLYATLLGRLSKHRFESVTDRFLHELSPVATNQIPKDMDLKYEHLVKALKHVEIKVWPPEAFEEGAEFMESLSKCFENTHGYRLKFAFAETLVQLLHPIGKTAQAEVNHPGWAKAIEIIYLKARDMMNKPRYWQVAYPLVITSLCVAPQEFFLKNWLYCFESNIPKLKERPFRIPVLNGIMRLVWTYLYRCRETTSAATNRLDGILRHFFPLSRLGVNYVDDNLEPLIYLVHFILTRHLDFGTELVLNLMQEQQVKMAQSGNASLVLAPERTTIALEATLRSLYLMEKEESAPTWPSNADFSVPPAKDDYPSLATFCPPIVLAKPGMDEFFDKLGSVLVSISVTCSRSVGQMSIFDDDWAYMRLNSAYEDSAGLVIRQHPEVTVAYPAAYSGQMNLLATCFSSWPRCLHPSLPLDEALDMLIRAIIHVEPSVSESASNALRCISEDPAHIPRVLSRFASFLFSPKQFTTEASGTKLPFESMRLLNVWLGIVEAWADGITGSSSDFCEGDTTWLNSQFFDVEAAALFLLSSRVRTARSVGVKLIRVLERIVDHFQDQPSTPLNSLSDDSFRILDALLGKGQPQTFLFGFDDLLDAKELSRLAQWRQLDAGDVLLRLASSEDERDWNIWLLIYPSIIRSPANRQSKVILSCRDMWVAATTRYHPAVISLSGINNNRIQANRGPNNAIRERDRLISDNTSLIEQWHMWFKLRCCTATLPEPKIANHTRIPSVSAELNSDRDIVAVDTKGLLRYLIRFLDSDYSIFRDIVQITSATISKNR
ncbi:uncharacterized protein FOMMEDRAFT_165904 [Fomitiporia mediterranea MF3/22]|uniref:uncharacterized protein n=1 Tax=Fomitiporia mediterranea (strain MF3/22) TaxID=694068 RepID=UPI00044086D4|nr:uncharacterized protein FOMMEDRAFT_165904 [Fomitiporia mediterranea MF3/22]EJD05494.1 hypothetical protein FOMMEDRAFT_165904 [Fomitiporia mediterranea MF3/22]